MLSTIALNLGHRKTRIAFYQQLKTDEHVAHDSAPCGGCGGTVGSVHVCPVCAAYMHAFCGTPVGKEGYGQRVLCPRCETEQGRPSETSNSSFVAAFQRTAPVVHSASPSSSTSSSTRAKKHDTNTTADDKQPRTRSRPATTAIIKRQKMVRWIEEQMGQRGEGGSKGVFAAAVDEFPEIFKSRTRNSNIAKAMDWWGKKATLLDAKRGSTTLYPDAKTAGNVHLVGEFDRLRKAGQKFDAPLLRQLALRILKTQGDGYDNDSVDSKGALLRENVTPRWIQYFMECHNIVLRTQTGKKQVSEAKQQEIEQGVASHLGKLKRGFENGSLNEDTVENIDKTHFVIDFDNGKTLGFVGEKKIKYADVVSGGEGMTMVVRIAGGPGARILPPTMILMNKDSSYPIRGVMDDTPGVCYRTGPKGWMDKRLFREFLGERRSMSGDRLGREKIIFLDNCSSHLSEDECKTELDKLNARLRYFPANSTDLCQPADSFVIAKIKDVWARKWNEKKIDLIEDDQWQAKVRKDGAWSGKLKNPGKKFFLELAAEAVREVNSKRDKNGLTYARKAMIRFGLPLDIDGTWHIEQLFPHLRDIIHKYPDHFANKVASSSDEAGNEGREALIGASIGTLPGGGLYSDL